LQIKGQPRIGANEKNQRPLALINGLKMFAEKAYGRRQGFHFKETTQVFQIS
jgi:hypothetical protein